MCSLTRANAGFCICVGVILDMCTDLGMRGWRVAPWKRSGGSDWQLHEFEPAVWPWQPKGSTISQEFFYSGGVNQELSNGK